MTRITTSRDVALKLAEAGVLTQEQVDLCSRIVIDVQASALPQMYLQLDVTDDIIAAVAPMLTDILPRE